MASDLARDVCFDEHADPDGRPRPGYELALPILNEIDLQDLCARVADHLSKAGVDFDGQPFVIDPIPRLIPAPEWAALEEGLVQRAKALNAFLRDAYGERRIVEAGLVSAEVIDEAEGYEPDLAGHLPSGGAPAALIGFDLVRNPEGELLVLEDNLRTPSGLAYLLAGREALLASLPAGLPRPRAVDPRICELLAGVLDAAVPEAAGEGDSPLIVVLTDGPQNVAYYEHRTLADRLGLPLLTPSELERRGSVLHARLGSGEARRVDVVYRRTDEDRIRDQAGQLTAVAELLLEPWLDGNLGLVNAFGNGLADDKLMHAHVESFIRFYLSEEPLVRSVPTFSLDPPGAAREASERLRELVIKPRHGHGGIGVVIGAQADPAELERVRGELERHPQDYVAQPIIPLSRHPTVIEGRLEPRHVDLRPFVFCGAATNLAPGGLSRVAFDAGEMVVNSSQNGGGKDTWVIDSRLPGRAGG